MDNTSKNTDLPEASSVRFEYGHLRSELQHNGTLSIQVLGGTLLVAGTLMTVAFNDKIPNDGIRALIFTLAGAVLLLGRFFAADRRITERIIASYLCFLEDNGKYWLNWETKVSRLRETLDKYPYSYFSTYQGHINSIFFLANVLLVIFFAIRDFLAPGVWRLTNEDATIYFSWILAGVAFFILVLAWFRFDSLIKERDYYLSEKVVAKVFADSKADSVFSNPSV